MHLLKPMQPTCNDFRNLEINFHKVIIYISHIGKFISKLMKHVDKRLTPTAMLKGLVFPLNIFLHWPVQFQMVDFSRQKQKQLQSGYLSLLKIKVYMESM